MNHRPGGGLAEVSPTQGETLEKLVANVNQELSSVTPDATSASHRKGAELLIAKIGDAATREQFIQALSDKSKVKKSIIATNVEAQRRKIQADHQRQHREVQNTKLMARTVDPAVMLERTVELFRRHAYLPEGAAHVLAMWAINTWTFRTFRTVPYLSLESATKGCGKTTVLELLEAVCAAPFRATSMTPAVLFHIIESDSPTVLIDEAEVLFSHSDGSQHIRAIAQAGYKQGGSVPRVVGEGAQSHVARYDVFCPKAFATIGGLRGALQDRCIVVRLEKAPRSHRVTPIRQNALKELAGPLRADMEAYSAQVRDELQAIYESEPAEGYWPELLNREAEIWTPLLTNARLIGAHLEEELRRIALTFSRYKQQGQSEESSVALSRELLQVLQDYVDTKEFQPSGIVQHLRDLPTWGAELETSQGKAASMKVAKFIKKYGVHRKHDSTGSVYPTNILMEKLKAHLPEEESAEVPDLPSEALRADAANGQPGITDVAHTATAPASL